MAGGDNAFYLKFWGKLTLLELKRQFSNDIHSASVVTPSEKKFN